MSRKVSVKENGSYVVDVTRADLDGAKPNNPGHCAIARAVKRKFANVEHIKVGDGTISFTFPNPAGGKQRATLRTSLRAAVAQHKLDNGQPVDPADFPPIRLHMDEAVIKPSGFDEATRLQQNEYRRTVREGTHKPEKMTEKEKAKRRLKRRHA